MTAAGRKAISIAMKARWAKAKAAKAAKAESNNNNPTSFIFRDHRKTFSFLAERCKMYDSVMEAYVDGYLDGAESTKGVQK